MKVILLKELRGRGGEGDVIDVARGFANNYLFTQGYAVKATKGNLKQLEQRRSNIEKREEIRVADANALAEKLEGAKVKITAQVGDEGQLFGSVTAPMIADAIADELGIEIDKRRIDLGKPIKAVGEYQLGVSIYRTIKATVTVVVAGEGAAAEEAEEVAEAAEAAAEEAVEAEEAAEIAEGIAETVEAAETAEAAAETADAETADAAEAAEDAAAE